MMEEAGARDGCVAPALFSCAGSTWGNVEVDDGGGAWREGAGARGGCLAPALFSCAGSTWGNVEVDDRSVSCPLGADAGWRSARDAQQHRASGAAFPGGRCGGGGGAVHTEGGAGGR